VERLLPNAPAAAQDFGAFLDAAVRIQDVAVVSRVLTQMKKVPAGPFLQRLEHWAPQDRLKLLGWAAHIHGIPRAATLPSTLTALFQDADPRTRVRAAVVGLVLLGRGDTIEPRQQAVKVLSDALQPSPAVELDGESVATDLAPAGANAVPLLPALLGRLETAGEARVATLGAIAAMGPEAASALPALVKRLRVPSDVSAACDALGALGVCARRAMPSLLTVATSADDDAAARAIAALDSIEASPEATSWRRLVLRYAQRCRDADAIALFSLSRDDRCAEMGKHLKAIAARSHQKWTEAEP